MNREQDPDRLRKLGGNDLERRLLNAAAEEKPTAELSQRMASTFGASLDKLARGGSGGGTSAGPTAGKAATGVGAGSSGPLLWVALASVALVGAIVGVREWTRAPHRDNPTQALTPEPSTAVPAAPETAKPASALPASNSAPVPGVPDDLAPARSRRGREASSQDLREQISIVDGARVALSTGSAARALDLLRQYQEKYPAGLFRPEAAAIKVEAMVKLGKLSEARELAARFAAEFGEGALADRVARIVQQSRP